LKAGIKYNTDFFIPLISGSINDKNLSIKTKTIQPAFNKTDATITANCSSELQIQYNSSYENYPIFRPDYYWLIVSYFRLRKEYGK